MASKSRFANKSTPKSSLTHIDNPGAHSDLITLHWWAERLRLAAKTPWLAALLLRRAWEIVKAIRPSKQVVASVITGAALALHTAIPAMAYTVESTVDDTLPVLAANSTCDLREAMIAANTNAPYQDCDDPGNPNLIDMSTISGNIAIANTNLPYITESVQINGPGATNLSINGGGSYFAFYGNSPGVTIGVDSLTIKRYQ